MFYINEGETARGDQMQINSLWFGTMIEVITYHMEAVDLSQIPESLMAMTKNLQVVDLEIPETKAEHFQIEQDRVEFEIRSNTNIGVDQRNAHFHIIGTVARPMEHGPQGLRRSLTESHCFYFYSSSLSITCNYH